jgi:hypothetical protein
LVDQADAAAQDGGVAVAVAQHRDLDAVGSSFGGDDDGEVGAASFWVPARREEARASIQGRSPDAAGEGDGPHASWRAHPLGERTGLTLCQQFEYHAGGAVTRVGVVAAVTSGGWGAVNGVEAAGPPFGGWNSDDLVDGQSQGVEVQGTPRSVRSYGKDG